MRLKKSRLAEADLVEIVDYGVDRFGVELALAYIDAIETCCRALLDFPHRGRTENELHHGLRSVSSGSHRVYYAIEDDQVVIRRVLHKSRDAKLWLT